MSRNLGGGGLDSRGRFSDSEARLASGCASQTNRKTA
jgi:hypothetical protein